MTFTIIDTTKSKYSIQFEGNLTQAKIDRVSDRLNLGYLIDIFRAKEGETTSAQIGTKIKGDKVVWTIDPNFKHLIHKES